MRLLRLPRPVRVARIAAAGACAIIGITQAAAQPPPQPAPIKPAKVEQVRKLRAEGLVGQNVMDANGEVFGHVVDILIDADGTPHAAVIEITGFFGIGDRRIAVAWSALQFRTQNDHIAIVVPLDVPKLKAMPEYTREASSVPVATPTAPPPSSTLAKPGPQPKPPAAPSAPPSATQAPAAPAQAH
jgi:sporulation protein YlmC with PRC-barrel domain